MRRTLLILLPALFGLPFQPLAEAEKSPTWPIQPGAPLGDPATCTLNFVFRNATDWFIGTAAHCVVLGERVRNPEVGVFGTVVFEAFDATDFALIKVDARLSNLVAPDVRHWGGPTGVSTRQSAPAGDAVAVYGYGVGFGVDSATRPRVGILVSHGPQRYVANTGAVPGDSGAPILDHGDGRALGIVSRYHVSVPPATDEGPTLLHIMNRLRAAGFDVELATAPYHPTPT